MAESAGNTTTTSELKSFTSGPGVNWEEAPVIDVKASAEEATEDTEEKVDAQEEEKGEGKALLEDKEQDSTEKTAPPVKEEEEEASGDEEEGEEETVETKETEEAPAAEEVPAKIYKFRTEDGKVIEIPDNAIVKMKANGKFRRLSFKELKDSKAGEIAWDEKIREANDEKRAVQQQAQQLESQINGMNEAVKVMLTAAKNKDFGATMYHLSELVGAEPGEFIQSWLGMFGNFWDQIAQMAPEERKNTFLKLENSALEQKKRKETSVSNFNREVQATQKQLDGAKAKFGIQDEELVEAYEALQQSTKDASTIKVVDVVNLVLDNRVLTQVKSAAQKIGVKAEDRQLFNVWSVVKEAARKRGADLPEAEILKLTRAVLSDDSVDDETAETLSRKVQKKPAGKKISNATPKRTESKELTAYGSLNQAWDALDI